MRSVNNAHIKQRAYRSAAPALTFFNSFMMAKPRTFEEMLEEAKKINPKDFELPPDGTYCPDPDPVDDRWL